MSTDGVDKNRRRFLTATTSVVGAVGVAGAAIPFVVSMQPSARAKAAGAPVEADISKLEEGGLLTVEWRGQPVWILRRTQQNLDDLAKLDTTLADPNSELTSQQPVYAANPHRSRESHPEIMVMVGICTHLGCSPTFYPTAGQLDADWLGGFFCPCHGSKFDMAGRVWAGVPAPSNLVVPPYQYLSDTVILIGDDQGAA